MAIAASSAMYGFCSSLEPMVMEYLASLSSSPSLDVSRKVPPAPTVPAFSDALVATIIPSIPAAASTALSRSMSAATGR
ncbi:hypothetical protein E5D57_008126 [Metarhizium anisopliae]|nr:hypothetical protein E5D57_008126 [Metarhizium anisopliae]